MKISALLGLGLVGLGVGACGGGGGGGGGGGDDDDVAPDAAAPDADTTPTGGPRFVYVQSDTPPDDITGDVTMVRLLSQPAGEELDPETADRLFDGFVVYDEYGDVNPTLSPDGTMVAFLDDVDHDLYVAPVDGSAPATRLTDPGIWVTSFLWSPDSGRLLVDETGNWHLLSPDGSGDTYLERPADVGTEIQSARWAADSSRVAIRTYSGQSHVLVATPGQDEVIEVTPDGDVDFLYAISGDGARVAYSVAGSVYVADADGTDATVVSTGDSVTGSPDGARLVYRDGEDIESVGFDGMSPVTVHDGADYVGPFFYWSPDSSRFLYQLDSETDGFRLATPDGSMNVTVHATGPDHESQIKWAPDSSRVLFAISNFSGDGLGNHLYTAPAATGVATLVGRGFFNGWVDGEAVHYAGVDEDDREFIDIVELGPVATDVGDLDPDLKPLASANIPRDWKIRRHACWYYSDGYQGGLRAEICVVIIQQRVSEGSPYTMGPERRIEFRRRLTTTWSEWRFESDRTLGFFDVCTPLLTL